MRVEGILRAVGIERDKGSLRIMGRSELRVS
jgi:hypothetical protein